MPGLQLYSFHCFWAIKEKPMGWRKIINWHWWNNETDDINEITFHHILNVNKVSRNVSDDTHYRVTNFLVLEKNCSQRYY